MSRAPGHVSLVGAGPGDPGLLTRRAAGASAPGGSRVCTTRWCPPSIVALARRAQRFSVGKRCGRPSFRQETIHSLMIRAARRGRRVVRLKAGDPFVLGRGGEEALALRAAGVPFEVVPGVSSALAAPALAGIPVTHRGLSAGVHRRLGPRRVELPAAAGDAAAALGHRRRVDGTARGRGDRLAPDRHRMAGDDAGGGHLQREHSRIDDLDRHAGDPLVVPRRGACGCARHDRHRRGGRRLPPCSDSNP